MKRLLAQIGFFVLHNPYLQNFFSGRIYDGKLKGFCAPGLNCYSCPAAAFSCPIGSLQNFFRGTGHNISLFVTGFLIAMGAAFGRFVCGFACPMGFLQDLIYKAPTPKFRVRLRKLSYFKYIVLAAFVIILPFSVRDYLSGLGYPWFCAYICPSGTIFGAWPLLAANDFIRGMLGALFNIKTAVAIGLITMALFINRFFCRVLCPLGAIYAMFNKISFVRINHDKPACANCAKCSESCNLRLDPVKESSHPDCMRCGNCVRACGEKALKYGTINKSN
ncbi:MAG: 4Fe-4S binding protein [Defluviitaleaceae bacterium]|nr:4Fe-4S binding protein [Defluviitaleaceae bacterium]MCL2836121.1 4Fe-4S binding protein [Defluviitaleaceae bacterium]